MKTLLLKNLSLFAILTFALNAQANDEKLKVMRCYITQKATYEDGRIETVRQNKIVLAQSKEQAKAISVNLYTYYNARIEGETIILLHTPPYPIDPIKSELQINCDIKN